MAALCSALPSIDSSAWTSLGKDEKVAMLRSRAYSYASFAVGMPQSKYTSANIRPADKDWAANDRYTLEVRALSDGVQWQEETNAYSDGGGPVTLRLPSSDPRFSEPQEGAEVRAHWRYYNEDNPESGEDVPEYNVQQLIEAQDEWFIWRVYRAGDGTQLLVQPRLISMQKAVLLLIPTQDCDYAIPLPVTSAAGYDPY